MGKQGTLDAFMRRGAQASSSPARPRQNSETYIPSDDAESVVEFRDDTIPEVVSRRAAVVIDTNQVRIRPPHKSIDSSDPPMSDINEMFRDLLKRFPDFERVLEFFQTKEALNVATMCSGTESPLLALKMIDNACFDLFGIHLRTNHIFSCEIVDYKQAYIERNFQPKILFRDVCELGNEMATTAYGSQKKVPLNCNILIAGTSCVDYSALNNKQQKITDNGESGRTFRGMMGYVRRARPAIILLENVCKAPWDQIVKYFKEEGYAATFTRFDTKDFYIPHTRNRVYLIAFDARKGGSPTWSLPEKWHAKVVQLKRPASSPLDAFLLPADDPHIHRARETLVKEARQALNRGRARIDWSRCEGRHQRARLNEELGTRRPFTYWEDGAKCSMPDWTWRDWGVMQVERVWDLVDITLLRYAKEDWDPSYKTLVWNLSQNVDRQIGSGVIGVAPCLTPSMIPYITNRGGPMTGLEALALQGLPINELLLTRETEDNLADLAGNAMTSTVVGSATIAALFVGLKHLFQDIPDREKEDEDMEGETGIQAHIGGEDRLASHPLDLAATKSINLKRIFDMAQRSARLCICEGRSGMTTDLVHRCKDCLVTTCSRCGGRPTHNYEAYTIDRLSPIDFEKELKAALPMCLEFSSITEEDLELENVAPDLDMDRSGRTLKDADFKFWQDAVLRATSGILRFTTLKRQELWVIHYDSASARLELVLYPTSKPQWFLYAKPESGMPANSPHRPLLSQPILRSTGKNGFFDGPWQFGLPITEKLTIKVEGKGELVPSFQSSLGLQGEFADGKVWDMWKISVNEDDVDRLDFDISGEYKLLPDCGNAARSLHRRATSGPDGKELFFFRDPERIRFGKSDSYTFSWTHRRLDHGEDRPVLCTLDKTWREHDRKGAEKITAHVSRLWTKARDLVITPIQEGDASYAVPVGPVPIDVEAGHCETATAILTCEVPIKDEMAAHWSENQWTEVDVIHERAIFQNLSWLTERVKTISNMQDWSVVQTAACDLPECISCAPKAPTIQWFKAPKKGVIAMEDMAEAGKYEQALKSRTSPFVTQLRLLDGVGTMRIGVNFASLIHRAAAALPDRGNKVVPELAWRLTTDYMQGSILDLPKFRLTSNRRDVEAAQPPNFKKKVPLRKEQLRSLTWMLRQEAKGARPFIEEEIVEAVLEPLGWRAEGRATRPAVIRGGVLADQVGYGKTAITLGLIDAASQRPPPAVDASVLRGRIPALQTTCCVVPPHLIKQWPSEFRKFLKPDAHDIVVLESMASLNRVTIEEIQNAKIVLVASNLFQSKAYVERLGMLAGKFMPLPGTGSARHYRDRLDTALSALRHQMSRLMGDTGAAGVWSRVKSAQLRGPEAEEVFVQSIRLKGQKYRDAHANDSTANVFKKGKKDAAGSSPASKRRRSDDEAEESEEESDEPAIKKQKAAKAVVDPWGLQTSKVKNKWQQMTCPPLEAFLFERLVVDEYTYLKDAPLASVTRLSSAYRWVLSGTPPVHNFAAVKTIAVFLDVHLGIDDAGEMKGEQGGRGRHAKNEQTSVEKFHSFREVRSPAWHARRHEKAQEFLDHFVRQNIAEIDEIPCEQSLKLVTLPAAERAIYLELLHHLMALDMTIKKGKRGESDRDKRLAQSLGDSESAEEALLKRCSHFDLDMDGITLDKPHKKADKKGKKGRPKKDVSDDESAMESDEEVNDSGDDSDVAWVASGNTKDQNRSDNALQACDVIVRDRTAQRDDCERDLKEKVKEALIMERKIGSIEEDSPFRAWMKGCQQRGVNDKEATARIVKLIRDAVAKPTPSTPNGKLTTRDTNVTTSPSFDKGNKGQKGKSSKSSKKENKAPKKAKKAKDEEYETDNDDDDDEAVGPKKKTAADIQEEIRWDLREQTHVLRRLEKELVGRVRSLRYFANIRDLQTLDNEHRKAGMTEVVCPNCPYTTGPLPLSNLSILSSCGHMACHKCVREHAVREECVYRQEGCRAQARELNIVHADTLGMDETHDRKTKHYGIKLEKIVQLIKHQIPQDERVLVFVQFPDLTEKVAAALQAHKISFLQIRGSASSKSKALQEFQNPDASQKVLLLNVMDESASGANLTVANHAIFISPLLAPSQEIYEANETQAIGRLQRFGQTKMVHVYRFLTTNSVDVTIFEERNNYKVDQTKKSSVLKQQDIKRHATQHEKLVFDHIEVPSLGSVGHRSRNVSASPPIIAAEPIDLTMSDESPSPSVPAPTSADLGTEPEPVIVAAAVTVTA
ncbi:hypothetical protein DACRYDRAFT_119990 [Dacryopinax primogenitus]|uniref:Helicase C-terminal domain-containing protein n=1 Tax=Dacryopinax primogenitus (strain DJM 731) TaxID=1858805 RepID=M5FNY7_DACPD|nr:uncharacterized protein DACRYDRAFT_119990 [Dacryopinax primogenitus]EJT96648.1 hypothetical protein DACRYDRAFT_119990 [Dacryopinax primogenitus]